MFILTQWDRIPNLTKQIAHFFNSWNRLPVYSSGAMEMEVKPKPALERIAVIGDYLPRQCGIATFTSDLCEALAGQFPSSQIFAVPVTDSEEGYEYPPRVRFEFVERDVDSYAR